MPLPDGFKKITMPPWELERAMGEQPYSICTEDECILECHPANLPSEEHAQLFLASPDHALLLAAIVRGVATMGIGGERIFIGSESGPSAEADLSTLDPFGCPILSNECRNAIIAALGAQP